MGRFMNWMKELPASWLLRCRLDSLGSGVLWEFDGRLRRTAESPASRWSTLSRDEKIACQRRNPTWTGMMNSLYVLLGVHSKIKLTKGFRLAIVLLASVGVDLLEEWR